MWCIFIPIEVLSVYLHEVLEGAVAAIGSCKERTAKVTGKEARSVSTGKPSLSQPFSSVPFGLVFGAGQSPLPLQLLGACPSSVHCSTVSSSLAAPGPCWAAARWDGRFGRAGTASRTRQGRLLRVQRIQRKLFTHSPPSKSFHF